MTLVTSDCEILTEDTGLPVQTESSLSLTIEACSVTLTFDETDDIKWSEIHSYLRDVIDTRADALDRVGKSVLDVSVTNSGTNHYVFNGDATGNDPVLVLMVGDSLRVVNTSGAHPFKIKNSTGVVVASESSATVNWTPTAAGVYTYYCDAHPSTMTNSIHVIDTNNTLSLQHMMILGNQCDVTTSSNGALPTTNISVNALRNMKFTTII